MDIIKRLINIIEFARKNFSDVYAEAFSVLKNRSVKKYIFHEKGFLIYTVVGNEGEYLLNIDVNRLSKSICTCKDYTYNILFRSKKHREGFSRIFCHHILAIIISKLAEYAFMTKHEGLDFFKKKELLPEIIIEEEEYFPLILDLAYPSAQSKGAP